MSRFLRSSAFTLAFGYVAFGIGALVLFAAPLWYAWQVTIQDGRMEVLRMDAQRFAETFRRDGPSGLASLIDTRLGLQIANERVLLLTDSVMHPLAGNLPAWPASVPTAPGTYNRSVVLAGKQTAAMFVHTLLPGQYHLLVGRDQTLFEPLTTRFWYGLAGAVAGLSIAAALAGLMIRRAVLLRVAGIRQAVLAIVQGNLGQRLPADRSSDELDTLSRTINGMLDHIEQLVDGVRDVSNAIAHDLRTPLAELRSRLEELVLTRPEAEQVFTEIDAAVVDVDRVIRIFNALLRLAEIDSGLQRSGFVTVDAAELARQAVDFYLPAAELKRITLTYHGSGHAEVPGDPVLLAQAMGNLIDNALKYAGDDGSVRVEVESPAEGPLQITVADDGPGIPDEEKPKVPTRFYRGDASRGTPGVGLGLSLVQSVAKVHGGTLELEDNHPGLRVRMVIPRNSLVPSARIEDQKPSDSPQSSVLVASPTR